MEKQWQGLPPREKLIKHGVGTLSDTELLALFLRTGRNSASNSVSLRVPTQNYWRCSCAPAARAYM